MQLQIIKRIFKYIQNLLKTKAKFCLHHLLKRLSALKKHVGLNLQFMHLDCIQNCNLFEKHHKQTNKPNVMHIYQ